MLSTSLPARWLAPLALALAASACADSPAVGSAGGACYPNSTCDRGLTCSLEALCVTVPSSGDAGLGDGGTGPAGDAATPGADASADAGVAKDAAGSGADVGLTPDSGVAPPSDSGTPSGPLAYTPPEGCFRSGPSVLRIQRRSLVATASGHVHLALGGDALYYGQRAPGAASVSMELVDPHGGPASIALGPQGEPVIVYFDRFRRSTALAPEIEGLKLARRVQGRWQVSELWSERRRVRRMQDDNPAPAIVVDGRGLVHLALKVYDARLEETLELMTWDGQRLVRTPYTRLPNDQNVRNMELLRDNLGEPMLVFDTYTRLWLVRHDASGWREPELVTSEQNGNFVEWTAFVDGAGRPGVALIGTETGRSLAVWRQTAVGWDRVSCVPGLPAAYSESYQPGVLADGTPIFATRYYAPRSAGVASTVRVGQTCAVEPIVADEGASNTATYVDDEEVVARPMGFAVGGRVRALLRFEPSTHALELQVSDDDGATYRALPVMEPRVYGLSPSIVVLPDGRPVITSVEQVQGTLEVSTYDPAAQRFVTEAVPMGPAGERCRVLHARLGSVDTVVHGSGELLVSYARGCESVYGTALSRKAAFGWTQQEVPAGNDVALTLALQPDGRPAIATPSAVLSYDGAAWSQSNVTGGGVMRGYAQPALAYDGLGRALHGHLRDRDVHLARRDPQLGWVTEIVDTHSNYLGLAPAQLRLTSAGEYVYAYGRYSVSNSPFSAPGPTELRVATRGAAGWTTETVARLGWDGEYNPIEGLDLALLDDRPVVVYRSAQHSALELAWRDARGTWTTQTLTDDGDTGLYPSLALVGRTAHVAFHHAGTGDLCYVRATVP